MLVDHKRVARIMREDRRMKLTESFMKTLKREEIYANEYQEFDDRRTNIETFIEQYYNRQRLHSALGYRPPEEFEQVIEPGAASSGASMSFFRHKEIFRSDVDSFKSRETAETASPALRLDESPAGYSSAGWSPPEPGRCEKIKRFCSRKFVSRYVWT
jgi:hypothetical protein